MTKKYAYQGEELTLKQIAYKTGLSSNLLRQRMNFYGHTLESAIALGVAKRGNITRVRDAAPQLLAALKKIAEFDEYEPAGPAARTARDAIALVEGKSDGQVQER